MTTDEKQAMLEKFVAEFNAGDPQAYRRLLPDFFGYHPEPGEQIAPETFREVAEAVRAAFPDLRLTLEELTADGERMRGRMTLAGTFAGPLWGVPGNGSSQILEGTAIARFEGDHFAVGWEGLPFVANLRAMGVLATPERAHLKPTYPPRLPEWLLRLAFNGMRLQEKPCTHLDRIRVTEPVTNVCKQCMTSGDEWPALRMCLECGFVGCCDLAVNKHMKKHCDATGHVLIRSITQSEAWLWCYADSVFLGSRHLHVSH